MKKIGIIGAGISGLYLANIINDNPDLDYKIFEKRDDYNLTEGYGIQLSVNSIQLLNKIGFKNLPTSEVCFPDKINFFHGKNSRKICDIDLSQFNYDLNRYSTLKRSTLLNFLLENIPQDKINFNIKLTHLEKGDIIKAKFSNNLEENFDFLVIADGVFSETKSLAFNKSIQPKYNNSIALRAIIKEQRDEDISICMGSNFHYVIYPVNKNNEYNFVSILSRKLTNQELNDKEFFNSESFLNSLKEIIEKNSYVKFDNLTEIKAYPVFVSDKIPNINQNNIFLSGDAFFALPPSLAQGASQSIETAQSIFDSIVKKKNDYYKKRKNIISSINIKSKLNHYVFHLSNPLNILLRNIFLKYLSKNKSFLKNYLGKIYKN